jgi:hypothetical protein
MPWIDLAVHVDAPTLPVEVLDELRLQRERDVGKGQCEGVDLSEIRNGPL